MGESVTGPVRSATTAAELSHRVLGNLVIQYGLKHYDALLVACEHLLLRLEPGEPVRATCGGYIAGFGWALLMATDRRLLGDGEGDWKCGPLWSDLEAARERHDRTDHRGIPDHELKIAGMHIEVRGPPNRRAKFIAAAIRGAVEDAIMLPLPSAEPS